MDVCDVPDSLSMNLFAGSTSFRVKCTFSRSPALKWAESAYSILSFTSAMHETALTCRSGIRWIKIDYRKASLVAEVATVWVLTLNATSLFVSRRPKPACPLTRPVGRVGGERKDPKSLVSKGFPGKWKNAYLFFHFMSGQWQV